MALKPESLDKLTDALVPVQGSINAFQADYLANNKRYWQGLLTPAEPSKEAADKEIEVERKPTDQKEDWFGILASTIQPCALEVHTHDGPKGMGYTVYAHSIAEDGSRWIRAVGIGEGSTTADWTEHKPLKLDGEKI